tara:strand:- start:419 stop:1120 length:702 start_codon:yes stop_codon:yes gene_type:complete
MHKFYNDYINSALKFSVNIDLTNKCILQCVFCMRQRQDGKQKIKRSSDMPFNDFKKIIKTFERVHLCGQLSDPIYHPHFLKYLKYASQKIKHIGVHTNGSGKKLKFWKEAASIPSIKWTFGIDGIDQKTVVLHRIGQNFFSSFRAMLICSKNKRNIQWQFIPFKHNEHQISKAKKIASKYKISFVLLKSNRWGTKEPIIVNNKKIHPDWIEKPSLEYVTEHLGEPTKDVWKND